MDFNADNKLVTCPYDEAHKVKASRLQLHIAKCQQNNLDKIKDRCPFNATHLFTASERQYHLLNCPDRAPLDRSLTQNNLDRNNPFKGRTAVPNFSDPVVLHEEDNWDDEPAVSYVPSEPPPDAIIEPQPMSQPAERRKLYMELHRQPTEADSVKTTSVAKPVTPRQPKQPSETQKLQSAQQQVNSQAIQNLGLGRGRSSRIAANIFDTNKETRPEVPSYSNIVRDMGNLGLGRGQSVNRGVPVSPIFNDDDDFPALGCGRGVLQAPRQNLRTPGVKTQK